LATTVCNCEERTSYKVLFLALAYKKCDLKTIEVWQAEQNKRQRIFAFSAKNWLLFCVRFCVVIGFLFASL